VGVPGQDVNAIAPVDVRDSARCARAAWVLNEKRIIEAAGLAATHDFFSRVPSKTEELTAWVAEVGGSINGGA
jgi:hypothetical protein